MSEMEAEVSFFGFINIVTICKLEILPFKALQYVVGFRLFF